MKIVEENLPETKRRSVWEEYADVVEEFLEGDYDSARIEDDPSVKHATTLQRFRVAIGHVAPGKVVVRSRKGFAYLVRVKD